MSDPPVFSWYTVNASVENSYISLQCQIFTYSAQNAIDAMTAFMQDVHDWTDGFGAVVTVDD